MPKKKKTSTNFLHTHLYIHTYTHKYISVVYCTGTKVYDQGYDKFQLTGKMEFWTNFTITEEGIRGHEIHGATNVIEMMKGSLS